MSAAQQYFAPRYFNAHYFAADYFGGTVAAPAAGSYWARGYWNSQYWKSNYWAGPIVGTYWAVGYWNLQYWKTDYWPAASLGSINVGGQIASTLDGATSVILGTFSSPGVFHGSVQALLDHVIATWIGSTVRVEYFDITIPFTPNWHSTEYVASTGDVNVTLADDSGVFVGTFIAADGRTGLITVSLDDATGVLAGTHVLPAGRAGVISATLDAVSAVNFLGAVSPPGTQFGSITVTLGNVAFACVGSAFSPGRTGAIFAQLDPATTLFSAVNIAPGATLGVLSAALDDVRADFTGLGTPFKHTQGARNIIVGGAARTISIRRVR